MWPTTESSGACGLSARDGRDDRLLFTYDGGFYAIPKVIEPYGPRDWLDEQISWSK